MSEQARSCAWPKGCRKPVEIDGNDDKGEPMGFCVEHAMEVTSGAIVQYSVGGKPVGDPFVAPAGGPPIVAALGLAGRIFRRAARS